MITITASENYGFMIFPRAASHNYISINYFYNYESTSPYSNTYYDTGNRIDLSPIYGGNYDPINSYYVSDNHPLKEVTLDRITMPTTPFGYYMTKDNQTIKDTTPDTERYYSVLAISAPLNKSLDFANNNKQGLSITDFKVLEASEGVSVKLLDLRKDKAPDKGQLSNNVDFQTVTAYDSETRMAKDDGVSNAIWKTPYYLQFTKLPKTAGNYFVKVELTDNLGLTKKITLNFSTYENSITGTGYSNEKGLTVADTLFESNEDYLNKETGKAAVPMSNKEQILGKVTLNKDNAYIKSDEFPAGVELRPVEGKVDGNGNPTEAYVVKKEGVKVQPGVYSFSVKAHDGHFQDGGSRRFDFEIVDAINPIADQHWREGSVPPPISISMENHSHITGIRVESSGNYAYFEGNATNSSISVYGLKRTEAIQKARVYVTYTDGAGKSHETFTDFNYEIEPNTVDGLNITVTNDRQEIFEGDNFQDMVIETRPSEGVTIKVDKTKLPKGTRLVGNVIK